MCGCHGHSYKQHSAHVWCLFIMSCHRFTATVTPLQPQEVEEGGGDVASQEARCVAKPWPEPRIPHTHCYTVLAEPVNAAITVGISIQIVLLEARSDIRLLAQPARAKYSLNA